MQRQRSGYLCISIYLQLVTMVKSDWKEATPSTMDVLRCATTKYGVESVTTPGAVWMPQLCVVTSDSLDSVSSISHLYGGLMRCIQLSDAQAFPNAFFGEGISSIFLDEVQCTGDEVDIYDCPHNDGGQCGQSDNAGVECIATRKCLRIVQFTITTPLCLQLIVLRMT